MKFSWKLAYRRVVHCEVRHLLKFWVEDIKMFALVLMLKPSAMMRLCRVAEIYESTFITKDFNDKAASQMISKLAR